jgi:hypothetical protein
MIPLEASQKNPPPPGIRFRAPSTAGDEKLLHLSIAWCRLPQQLGRPLFNRRKPRSFHSAVLTAGDILAHRRCVLHLLNLGSFHVVLFQGPFCNMNFFEGSFCNMVA